MERHLRLARDPATEAIISGLQDMHNDEETAWALAGTGLTEEVISAVFNKHVVTNNIGSRSALAESLRSSLTEDLRAAAEVMIVDKKYSPQDFGAIVLMSRPLEYYTHEDFESDEVSEGTSILDLFVIYPGWASAIIEEFPVWRAPEAQEQPSVSQTEPFKPQFSPDPPYGLGA